MKYRVHPGLADPVGANEALATATAHLNGWMERGLPGLVAVTVEGGHYCLTLTDALPNAERDHIHLTEV